MTGKRFKDREFLQWAKRQGGFCCICVSFYGQNELAAELHHFDYRNRGTGMKGRDHWSCRLCRAHHETLQGKGRMWFVNNGELEFWTAMLEDALNLLSDYVLSKKKCVIGNDSDLVF